MELTLPWVLEKAFHLGRGSWRTFSGWFRGSHLTKDWPVRVRETQDQLQGNRILSCRVRAGRDLRLVLLWPSCPHKGKTSESGDNAPEDRAKVNKLSPVTSSEHSSLVVPKAKPILWTGTWDNIFPGFPSHSELGVLNLRITYPSIKQCSWFQSRIPVEYDPLL